MKISKNALQMAKDLGLTEVDAVRDPILQATFFKKGSLWKINHLAKEFSPLKS